MALLDKVRFAASRSDGAAWGAARMVMLISLLVTTPGLPARADDGDPGPTHPPQQTQPPQPPQQADTPVLAGPAVQLPDYYKGATFTGRFMGLGLRGGAAVALAHQLPDLTDKQRERIREVSGEFEARRRLWYREHGSQISDLRQQRDAAREAGDTQKADQIEQQRRELTRQAPQASQVAQALEQILSPGQRQQLRARLRAYQAQVRAQRRSRSTQPARIVFDVPSDPQTSDEINAD